MPEALERWPVQLMERLLPRQMQLIYEINAYVLAELRQRPDLEDPFLQRRLADRRGLRPRSCAWAIWPSWARAQVNGVSALHGELMKQTVFRPLHRLFPDRITAITNGVTPRRWLLDANPDLAELISETLGDQRWIADLERLEELAPRAGGRRRSWRVSPRSSRRTRSGWRPSSRERHEHRAADRRAVRRPDQAHPRVQAAAAQHPRGGGDLRRHAGRRRRSTACRGSRSSPARRRPPTCAPS